MNLEEKVKVYLELKDAKHRLETMLKEKLIPIKSKMEGIENEILDFLNETGQTSAKTAFGSPYKTSVRNVSVSNSDEFYNFVKKFDAFDLLQKKVTSSVYDRYIDDGIEVPGVDVITRRVVRIRKN